MINLEGQEAIDYLSRLESCFQAVKSDDDRKRTISSISSMLNLEIFYLQHLRQSGPSAAAQITVDGTGFPSLGPWVNDIGNLMNVRTQLVTKRREAVFTFLQQFINASTTGIETEGSRIASMLEDERPFWETLDQIGTDPHLHYNALSLLSNRFPKFGDILIYGDPDTSIKFLTGYKYLDSRSPDQFPPSLIMVSFSPFTDMPYRKLRKDDNLKIKELTFLTPANNEDAKRFFTNLSFRSREVFLLLDPTLLSASQFSSLRDRLLTMQEMIRDLEKSLHGFLDGENIDPETMQVHLQHWESSMHRVFDSDSQTSDYVLRQLQLTLAEEIKNLNWAVRSLFQTTPALHPPSLLARIRGLLPSGTV